MMRGRSRSASTKTLASRYGDAAMERWCEHPQYLRNLLVAGAHRIDLDGNVVGVVSEAERAWAWRALFWVRDRIDLHRRREIAQIPDQKAEMKHAMPREPKKMNGN
jgi:sRNA-binding protein